MPVKRTYAVGDIHGQIEKLHGAHALIQADRSRCNDATATVVHVGDLVDRGPDSAGVISLLMEGIDRGEPWKVLKGNHDRMFYGFMEDHRHHDPILRPDLPWMNPRLGGDTTMLSYGVVDAFERDLAEVHAEATRKIPNAHMAFLRGLDTYYREGNVVFVHAGIRPGVPLENQIEDDLTWIRKGFLEDTTDHGFLVVHGHTMIDAPTHYGNRLNIDSGAGRGGPLSAVVIEDGAAWLLTSEGRMPLVPEGANN